MPDLMVTRGNLDEAMALIQDEIERNHVALVSVSSGTTGKWGMARMWRQWMSATASWMAARGATMPLGPLESKQAYGSRPFNQDDAHELFTALHGYTDKYGERLSWSKSGHDGMRAATKGERLAMMMRHEAWASERGIQLMNPRDSEYRQLVDKMDK